MSPAADVAVIMANFNGARYLAAAIQSVVHQTTASWELIIVDDASTDDSIVVARQAAAGDPRIKIIAQDRNRGPAAARNIGLDVASAAWVAIVDSDDLMLPQRLELLQRRAKGSGAAIIADNLLVFSQSTRPRPFLTDRHRKASWVTLDEFIRSNCLYSRCPDLGYLKPMIRRDVIDEARLRYDETLRVGEDYNFLVRLMAHGYRLLLEPASLYLYRKHDGSVSHRLRSGDIAALIDAEQRFADAGRPFRPQVSAALKQRRRTMRSLLAYDAVVAAIKRGDLAAGVSQALKRPHIWPLLIQPVMARLRRLRAKLRPNHYFSPGDAELQAILGEVSSAEVSQAAAS